MLKNKETLLIILASSAYFLLLLFSYKIVGSIFIGDVLWYLNDSLNISDAIYNLYHVPLYPLIIASVKAIVFIPIPNQIIMLLINYLSFLFSAILIYRILLKRRSNQVSFVCSLFFIFWPLVVVTYSVFPLADSLVIFLFLFGLYNLDKQKDHIAMISFSLSLVTHKAIWPFVALVTLFYLISNSKFEIKTFIPRLLILVFPIVLLYVSGAVHLKSFSWILSTNIEREFHSESSLILFDGLIGEIYSGELAGLLKGLFLTLIFCFCIYISYLILISKKNLFDIMLVPIAIPILIYFIFLNQHEILAALRFGKLIILPAGIIYKNNQFNKLVHKNYVLYFIVFIMFITQIAQSYYIKIFYNL